MLTYRLPLCDSLWSEGTEYEPQIILGCTVLNPVIPLLSKKIITLHASVYIYIRITILESKIFQSHNLYIFFLWHCIHYHNIANAIQRNFIKPH